jgi:hypothetical protein
MMNDKLSKRVNFAAPEWVPIDRRKKTTEAERDMLTTKRMVRNMREPEIILRSVPRERCVL